MSTSDLDIQAEWSGDPLRDGWQHTPDTAYLLGEVARVAVETTVGVGGGNLLDVAAAEGEITCRVGSRFSRACILEPSATMLHRARERMRENNCRLELVRGIAETLPFPDAVFDGVLCHSALDHLADPERGIREMARVTKSDGRVILTYMNYGGLTSRTARALYSAGRGLGLVPAAAAAHLSWDSPVPAEHNFECTWANVSAMCAPYLDLDFARGVSLGWGFPGWGRLLGRLIALQLWLPRLGRFAERRPALADFTVTVWRPRPRTSWPVDGYRVRRTNPVYQRLIRDEADYWAKADFGLYFGTALQAAARGRNENLTGDPARAWLDDLAARGPFRDAAVLGCDDTGWEADWLRRNASPQLDVYELSPGVIAKVRQRLGDLAGRARFVQADLNFAALPQAAYDCIWASSTLHCLVNLEHVLDQIHHALRPGGLFAFSGWIGENRLQYDPVRLARVNELLSQVPRQYRRIEHVERPSTTWAISPFAAVRSAELLPLMQSHPGFEVVHEATDGRLFPLFLVVDCDALARDRPELLERLTAAETAAKTEGALRPTAAYVVLRRR